MPKAPTPKDLPDETGCRPWQHQLTRVAAKRHHDYRDHGGRRRAAYSNKEKHLFDGDAALLQGFTALHQGASQEYRSDKQTQRDCEEPKVRPRPRRRVASRPPLGDIRCSPDRSERNSETGGASEPQAKSTHAQRVAPYSVSLTSSISNYVLGSSCRLARWVCLAAAVKSTIGRHFGSRGGDGGIRYLDRGYPAHTASTVG
jgi:hypothetical protein